MTRFLVLLAFLAAGCPKNPPGGPPTPVTIAVDCAKKATHDVAIGIIGDVNTALVAATANWEAALLDLVAKWGIDAVKCAVAEVTNQSSKKAAASNDPIELLKAARGQKWLAAH